MSAPTAAQAARQHNRHSDGRYAEMTRPEPEELTLDSRTVDVFTDRDVMWVSANGADMRLAADRAAAEATRITADRQVAWVSPSDAGDFEIRSFRSPFDACEYAESRGCSGMTLNDDGTITMWNPDSGHQIRIHLPEGGVR